MCFKDQQKWQGYEDGESGFNLQWKAQSLNIGILKYCEEIQPYW